MTRDIETRSLRHRDLGSTRNRCAARVFAAHGFLLEINMAALGNTLTIPEPLGLFRTSSTETVHTPPPACSGASFALRLAQEREWVRIVGFQGSEGFHSRLAGMGLHVGAEVQVLCN